MLKPNTAMTKNRPMKGSVHARGVVLPPLRRGGQGEIAEGTKGHEVFKVPTRELREW